MKKLLFTALALLMLFTLIGCNDTANGGGTGDGTYRILYPGDPMDGEWLLSLSDLAVSMSTKETYEYTEEMLDRWEISGSVKMTQTRRTEMTKESLEDGVLTARAEISEIKYYISVTYEGSGAEAFKTKMRERFDAALENDEMTPEDYEKNIALLEGKEVEAPTGEEDDYEYGETHGIVVFRLRDDSTCLILKSVSYAGEEVVTETVFTYDGDVLLLEKGTSKYQYQNYEIAYYPNGKTKHELHYDKNGELDYEDCCYYNEQGLVIKDYAVWEWSGEALDEVQIEIITREYEYDAEGRLTKETETDENGDIESVTYEYYDNDQIKLETEVNADGSKYIVEYYENGQIKTECNYDENGNLWQKNEYGEDGKTLREEVIWDNGERHVTEVDDDGTETTHWYYADGTLEKRTVKKPTEGDGYLYTVYSAKDILIERLLANEYGDTLRHEYFDEENGSPSWYTEYLYYPDYIDREVGNDGLEAILEYTGNGILVRRQEYSETPGEWEKTYYYDNKTGALLEYETFEALADGTTKESYYRADGQLLEYVLTEYDKTGEIAERKWYDGNGRLTERNEYQDGETVLEEEYDPTTGKRVEWTEYQYREVTDEDGWSWLEVKSFVTYQNGIKIREVERGTTNGLDWEKRYEYDETTGDLYEYRIEEELENNCFKTSFYYGNGNLKGYVIYDSEYNVIEHVEIDENGNVIEN